jgi:DNA (cytosine-5)-methyltransferase 1
MLHAGKSEFLTPLLAIDIDPYSLTSYCWNMPDVLTLNVDIQKISPSVLLRKVGLKKGELGCLIASPPCQTYSRNNRQPKERTDYRNTLYSHTLRVIKGVFPWVVFMENVPEMETISNGEYHVDFIERLHKLGYRVGYWVVNAADYGVPQCRNRLIYLAYRNDLGLQPHCPDRTHGGESNLKPYVSVSDAISDLPERNAGDIADTVESKSIECITNSDYVKTLRSRSSNYILHHSARELNNIQMSRIKALSEGQAYDDLPRKLKPNKGYKASYGRLWRDKPAPTLTTYMSYPSCGRFTHYEQDRVITIREGLRLQSFHDQFRVFGNLMQQSTQVGNAVPPILAGMFKDVIVNDLKIAFNFR